MKVVAVVQARLGSTRFPGKVLRPLSGATLLERMVERVFAADEIDEVVVATTTDPGDEPIRALCAKANVRCFSGHPTDLLSRHLRAVTETGLGKSGDADVAVAKIPSDCPLIDPKIIDKVARAFRDQAGRVDFVSNLHPATYPDGNDVEIMPLPLLELAHREAQKPHEREHTTPFFWDQPDRFRLANVTWETGQDFSMSHRLTIDYPEDYELISAIYDELHDVGASPFSLQDILEFLDANPQIFALNQKYAGVNWYRHHLADLRTVTAEQTVQLEAGK